MSDLLDINHVRVGERHRKDMGDLDALAASIKELGLLSPILVTAENKLVAGHRRLEACRRIGLPTVEVRRVRQIKDAVSELKAERDENTCREPFKPSEAVALGLALEELEAPAREAQRLANLRHGSVAPDRANGPIGDTREVVGPAVGLAPRTYTRAKSIVLAQQDPDPAVAAAAKEATAEMDATGNVSAAERKVKAARVSPASPSEETSNTSGKSRSEVEAKVAKAKEMAARGCTSRQIAAEIGISEAGMHAFRTRHGVEVPADAVVGRTRRHDFNRIVETLALDAVNVTATLDVIDVRFDELDKERIPAWVSSLSEAIRSLTTLKRNLERELTQ